MTKEELDGLIGVALEQLNNLRECQKTQTQMHEDAMRAVKVMIDALSASRESEPY